MGGEEDEDEMGKTSLALALGEREWVGAWAVLTELWPRSTKSPMKM